MPAFRTFDAERFLRETWQKRPLLIRDPWQSWENPLDPEELAGLACEPDIESRLVRNVGAKEWELEHGPLKAKRFEELDTCPWTLLVQAVDHQVPAVAALIDPFRFIPNWRIDDVMVSYAVAGDGVGPHFDQYDVFLVQGAGRRRWKVGPRCDGSARLLPHDDLRLLADFEPVGEWVLGPGDILYVPPGFAHDGVAVGDDCMTYSIGFRAPSRGDLISGWADHAIDTLAEDDRYTDAQLPIGANPGEISSTALSRLQGMVLDALGDPNEFARWFGEYVTVPKDDRLDWSPETPVSVADLTPAASGPIWFERNPASRFSFIRADSGPFLLFVDGVSYECSGAVMSVAERMCASDRFAVHAEEIDAANVAELLVALVNSGCIAVEDPA